MKRTTRRALADVVAAAAATPAGADESGLADVLAAYQEAGEQDRKPGSLPAASDRRRFTRPFAVKCAAALVLATCAGTATAAAAGALPAPAQSLVHHYLGGIGVPAPRPAPSDTASPTTGPTGSAPGSGGGQSPQSSASSVPPPLLTLCRAVVQDGNPWRADLDKADRNALSTAAGGEQHVGSYCAAMVGSAASAPGSAPSPAAPAPGGPPPRPGTSGHPAHSHSPNPHASSH